jgi:DNA-binding NarL/FixJ family response regulator
MNKRTEKISLLTVRERDVLRLIATGLTSKEIGKKLSISEKTVEAHRNNIKRKLGVYSIAELTQCAIVMGLIKPFCP